MRSSLRSAVRSSLVLAAAALSAFVAPRTQAASLGVPSSPAPPSGYFVLVAPDTINDTVSIALGDVARFVTLTIEKP